MQFPATIHVAWTAQWCRHVFLPCTTWRMVLHLQPNGLITYNINYLGCMQDQNWILLCIYEDPNHVESMWGHISAQHLFLKQLQSSLHCWFLLLALAACTTHNTSPSLQLSLRWGNMPHHTDDLLVQSIARLWRQVSGPAISAFLYQWLNLHFGCYICGIQYSAPHRTICVAKMKTC